MCGGCLKNVTFLVSFLQDELSHGYSMHSYLADSHIMLEYGMDADGLINDMVCLSVSAPHSNSSKYSQRSLTANQLL